MKPTSIVALLFVSLAACGGSGEVGDAEAARIAFVQDLSAPDADEHALPALRSVELAVAQHPGADRVEIVVVDLDADPTAVEEIVADRTVVAAIVGPGADGVLLAEAGVPTLSVSGAGPTPARGSWRRFVPPVGVVADTIAGELDGLSPCVLSEDPAPDALAGLLAERLDTPVFDVEPSDADRVLAERGCDVVAWAGSPDAAVELTRLLPPDVSLVGGDRLLDPDFRDDVGPAGEGTRAVCGCADLSTSMDPSTRRFIQDYQSEYGLPPGPYAVEAWDAAHVLLRALGGSLPTRGAVRDRLGRVRHVEGLGTGYAFDREGELVAPEAFARLSRVVGGRWSPLAALG